MDIPKKILVFKCSLATMESGQVPVVFKLVEGEGIKPPLHADVIFPTEAFQLIKVFRTQDMDELSPYRVVLEMTAEEWVEHLHYGMWFRYHSRPAVDSYSFPLN
ncbi:MAG: hypothetical protein L6Q51_13790 [Cyclobacteriaceae bacterium]|nr:hypothetical protein [Cyclobacteriaceae bacterium]